MGLKICALTMVYQDYWALSRWYAHHGAEVGAQNLFIIAHGEDPRIEQICPGAQVIAVPRDDLSHFDRQRAKLFDSFQAELAREYDWVLLTDADELVIYDPDTHASLAALLEEESAPALTALGFDVVEMDGEPEMRRGPVLGQRRNLVFSGHYSKPVAARRPLQFRQHGVRVVPERLESFPYHMPKGLYLAHLKYANQEALTETNRVRRDVVASEGKGLPGKAWEDPEAARQSFLQAVSEMPLVPWDKAEAKAYRRLSDDPARLERSSVVRARKFRPTHRSKLPKRFGVLG